MGRLGRCGRVGAGAVVARACSRWRPASPARCRPRMHDAGRAGRSNATPSIAADGDVVAIAWGASTAGRRDRHLRRGQPRRRPRRSARRFASTTSTATRASTASSRRACARRAATAPRSPSSGRRRAPTARRLRAGAIGRRRPDRSRRATAVPGGDARRQPRLGEAVASIAAAASTPSGSIIASSRSRTARSRRRITITRRDVRRASPTASRWRSGRSCTSRRSTAPSRRAPSPAASATAARPRSPRPPTARVYAAWRHVYPGNIRDIAFTAVARRRHARSRRRCASARTSGSSKGVPDDGPAMAVDAQEPRPHRVADAGHRRRRPSPTIALFYATSTDGTRFTPRQSWGAWLLDVAWHVPLPALALALPIAATFERLQSQAMTEVVGEPFVQAARARGVSDLQPDLAPRLAGVAASDLRRARRGDRRAALGVVRRRIRHHLARARPSDVRGVAGARHLPGGGVRRDGIDCSWPAARWSATCCWPRWIRACATRRGREARRGRGAVADGARGCRGVVAGAEPAATRLSRSGQRAADARAGLGRRPARPLHLPPASGEPSRTHASPTTRRSGFRCAGSTGGCS